VTLIAVELIDGHDYGNLSWGLVFLDVKFIILARGDVKPICGGIDTA
jgi:hypothetical protein